MFPIISQILGKTSIKYHILYESITTKPSKEICKWTEQALIMSSLFNTRIVLCLMIV